LKEQTMNKKWYASKTIWVNAIAIVGIIVAGKEFDPQIVATVLAVVNFALRALTKENITW